MKIGIIVGSLRKESLNRKVANTLIALAPNTLEMEIIDISALPLFNQDDEATPPPAWLVFRDAIKKCDGILFVTPEYNRSVPAPLKNAIDVGSRPSGQSIWGGKPCAILSASPGAIGGFGANHHLRQSLVFLNMPCLQQPEMYLSKIHECFTETGLLNEGTQAFLSKFIGAFEKWMSTHLVTAD